MGDIEDGSQILQVQIEALAVMKIVKHCTEAFPAVVTGQLLGLDVNNVLEVTNCFPYPPEKEDDDKQSGQKYQVQMMKNLREVNVDNNSVGWYQSAYYGNFLNSDVIKSQYEYQSIIPKSVTLVFDPMKAKQGLMSIRAFRLSKQFMDLYKEKKFTIESVKKANLANNQIFSEVPVVVHTSLLATALMYELEPKVSDDVFEQLEISNEPFLEKNLEAMIGYVEDLTMEQNKIQGYYRAQARQQIQQQQYQNRLAVENAQRAARGEPPAPEEDLSQHPAFKTLNEPSKLDNLLVSNQIGNYCKQINQYAGQTFGKLFLTEGIFE